jgi:acetyl-CoA acetyltransferase
MHTRQEADKMGTLFGSNAVISGVGQTKVGRRLNRSGLGLTAEACLRAIEDAGLRPSDINGVATYPGAGSTDPGFVGAGTYELTDALGLHVDWFSGMWEAPGQFGPVIGACMAVASGIARHVVVFRTVTESSAQQGKGRRAVVPGGEFGTRISERHWSEYIGPYGGYPNNLVAMRAQLYMHEYGLTPEQMAWIALNARRHAQLNPNAIYQTPITMDDYFASRMITTPFRLFDCDVPCDGSTAVIVSAADTRPDLRRRPIRVASAACSMHGRAAKAHYAVGKSSLHDTGDFLWRHTDLRPADVDVAELYDGFSMLTLLWLEALQFCKVGEAGDFVDGGKRIALDGELPLNTQGGQLSAGRLHGLGFLHEACTQLWGNAGDRQVAGAPSVAVASAGGETFSGALLLVRD